MAKLALLEEINYHIGMLEDENNRLDHARYFGQSDRHRGAAEAAGEFREPR